MLEQTIEFLGTGTSTGVPVIGCSCGVCESRFEKDKRLRSSVLWRVKDGDTELKLLIDAGPDMRMQLLRARVKMVDAILITHQHYDHVGGLDDVRGINYATKLPLDIYAEHNVAEALKRTIYYVFEANKYPGVPQINLVEMNGLDPIKLVKNSLKIEVRPIRVIHGKMPIVGYRIGNWAYITDASQIPDDQMEELKGLDVLVINALRYEPHPAHFSVGESLDIVAELKPKRTYFTHVNHDIGLHDDVQKKLPAGVWLAYDGLTIK